MQSPSWNAPSPKLSLGFGIALLHALLIYFFIISKHPRPAEVPSFRTELRFITMTPLAIPSNPSAQQEPRKISTARVIKHSMPQPSIAAPTMSTMSRSDTANDTRITAPDFDQMLEKQKQQQQQSQQLNIDHGRLAKEIEAKGQRTLEFAPKANETALQKLNKGYERAAPYVEYESKSYINPDGSRMTKIISNKGTSCMRANRPHDRIDNRGPRLWKVEC
jgi:hypothetical protein